jgi:hypothetical protein
MPSEARDTMRLMLAGKIDQWFAKIDGSGAIFLMDDPKEALSCSKHYLWDRRRCPRRMREAGRR